MAYGSDLESFEDSIKAKRGSSSARVSNSVCDEIYISIRCVASQIVDEIVLEGGSYSFTRLENGLFFQSKKDKNTNPRLTGDPLIPYLRLDGTYHQYSSKIHSNDLKLELGYGAIAMNYHHSRFDQTQPSYNLEFERIFATYRMSFGDSVEADLGLGRLNTKGERTRSYDYFTTPLLVHASPWAGFEFRPAWAANMAEYDLAVMLKTRYAALKGGYKWLNTDDEKLKGPYAGVTFYF
ncbi:hypothetical protein [Vibrio sp. WXL210]|uniref:hypothetical protein n=1 Tax=Vibrio sp. WXL210 TaxID=3450709 RepID=UPI003EC6149F